jgi:hypothetical protein
LSLDNIKCSCGKSSIIIDDDSVNLTCGVKGLIEVNNARINKGKVECALCHKEFYEQCHGN